ncbi:MAG: hypothetical protein IID28_05780 [Planctomycetes bacterium]|nr:hypothetical protein [Planctomycetota bacterium]
MALPDWIGTFIEPLDRLGIVYMVTGSVGAMAYGEPRMTTDVNVVLRLALAQAGGARALQRHPERDRDEGRLLPGGRGPAAGKGARASPAARTSICATLRPWSRAGARSTWRGRG